MMPLFDAPQDPLGESRIPASGTERRIFDLLREAHGHQHAIPIRTLHSVTGLSERAIKEAVAELVVTHRIRIGGCRGYGERAGYFMIESAEDLRVASEPYEAQILSMLKRLRVLNGKGRVREWLGQQVVKFE